MSIKPFPFIKTLAIVSLITAFTWFVVDQLVIPQMLVFYFLVHPLFGEVEGLWVPITVLSAFVIFYGLLTSAASNKSFGMHLNWVVILAASIIALVLAYYVSLNQELTLRYGGADAWHFYKLALVFIASMCLHLVRSKKLG